MVSSDHRRMVASADAERRYRGGLAEPPEGSNVTEYTGPLCPMSFRVVEPPFSRILFSEEAEDAISQEIDNDAQETTTYHLVLNLSGSRSAFPSAFLLSDSIV